MAVRTKGLAKPVERPKRLDGKSKGEEGWDMWEVSEVSNFSHMADRKTQRHFQSYQKIYHSDDFTGELYKRWQHFSMNSMRKRM